MTPYQRVLQNPTVAAILETWPGAVVTMKEPNQFEVEGMIAGGEAGGAFLEGIGKTDLSALSFDEYMEFVEKVIRTYETKTMDLYTGGDPDSPPFLPV